MEVRVIRTDEDHEAALKEIERLWDAAPGSDDEARLDALATLVERYEAVHHPIPPVSPLEVLKFMMAQNGRAQADLAKLLGSKSRASDPERQARPDPRPDPAPGSGVAHPCRRADWRIAGRVTPKRRFRRPLIRYSPSSSS